MARKAAEILVDSLVDWNVEVVFGLPGDGINGIMEALRRRRDEVVILKNNTPGQNKWEQMVFLGNPEYGCDLHPIDFAAFARACGARGYTLTRPEEA